MIYKIALKTETGTIVINLDFTLKCTLSDRTINSIPYISKVICLYEREEEISILYYKYALTSMEDIFYTHFMI